MMAMSRVVNGPTVRVQLWCADYPPYSVGGSIYAVPGGLRVAAAKALVTSHCRVHADIIIDAAGHHLGVTWRELADIRRLLPKAQLDLHLIMLGGAGRLDQIHHERRALAAAVELGAAAITMTYEQIQRHREDLDQLRLAGHQVWVEMTPTDRITNVDGVDGALIMFIEPGTKNSADLTQLATVAYWSSRLPVGVDGGITRTIAPRCLADGACYLVSGRDLLTIDTDHQSPTTVKGSRP